MDICLCLFIQHFPVIFRIDFLNHRSVCLIRERKKLERWYHFFFFSTIIIDSNSSFTFCQAAHFNGAKASLKITSTLLLHTERDVCSFSVIVFFCFLLLFLYILKREKKKKFWLSRCLDRIDAVCLMKSIMADGQESRRRRDIHKGKPFSNQDTRRNIIWWWWDASSSFASSSTSRDLLCRADPIRL